MISLPIFVKRLVKFSTNYTASGPQLQGSLGSIGLRPLPPHCSRDPAHGPGVGLGRLPRLPPPSCARPVSGAGLGPSLLSGFTAVVSRPPPVASFSLCDLRLFVIKRTYSLSVAPRRGRRCASGACTHLNLPQDLVLTENNGPGPHRSHKRPIRGQHLQSDSHAHCRRWIPTLA